MAATFLIDSATDSSVEMEVTRAESNIPNVDRHGLPLVATKQQFEAWVAEREYENEILDEGLIALQVDVADELS